MTKDEALDLALEALEKSLPRLSPYGEQDWLDSKAAITALREALAEQPAQPQPVAWLVCENWRKHSLFFTEEGAEDFKNAAQREDDLSGNLARWKAKPLYTSPPAQRKPLTDEEIWQLVEQLVDGTNGSVTAFVRAIEAAHGIKENT